MLAPVPLDEPHTKEDESSRPEAQLSADAAGRPAFGIATATPEDRARTLITHLEQQTAAPAPLDEFCDALSLFRRWYYRPEKQRSGEVFLPNADGSWPIRRILNGAARVVLGPPTEAAPVDREAAKALKTKIIHAGREGVEKVVPVLPRRRKRTGSSQLTAGDSKLETS
jgi:hypothetical protein